ncbi:MAG: signal recognition particle protein Srp19 [Thaumarchaeota archaeon]|nr:signal recognition particle protein Srp19 [Nitrososphaerota archaeon]
MKEYGKLVIWLDYFDSSLSRAEGRRVPISLATKNPNLDRLVKAARALGYEPEGFEARHPKRPWRKSGYIVINKDRSKEKVIKELALAMQRLRD